MSRSYLTPQQQFIVDLYPAARQVSRETGMSWELILAQAAQETGWGAKVLPGTHNIFNIKASADWHGPKKTFNVWEIENGQKVWRDQAFRVYGSDEEALRDRVAFLRKNPRYGTAGLFDPGVKGDLQQEALALQRGRYATDPSYASHLVAVFNGPTMQGAVASAKDHATEASVLSPLQTSTARETVPSRAAVDRAAIYQEANLHFLAEDTRFEYGRSDLTLHNKEGNLRTDSSRTELDRDGDGLKGVDCSSFVWRGLKNAGYDVPPLPFTSHDLFNGPAATRYSRQHFDVISAEDARRPGGVLEPGDILMFKDKFSSGQHLAIFKGYDARGQIQFIGSQVSHGPDQVAVTPHGYWDGANQEIVGALRAKPAFHVGAALHRGEKRTEPQERTSTVPARQQHQTHRPSGATEPAGIEPVLQMGDRGRSVSTLQRRLFELGYRGEDGKPLEIDGDFRRNTLFALKEFQREHGLEGKGVAGPNTAKALDRAEMGLMAHPSHPQHMLYREVLERVRAAETARGIQVGAHSERVAAALVVECVRERLSRVDRVEVSATGQLAWAIENRPGGDESGLGRTDGINLPQASLQPLGESARQVHQVAVNVQTQQHEGSQPRHAPPAPVHTR